MEVVQEWGLGRQVAVFVQPTLADPMDGNTPSFPILHCLLEFAQTHVY